MPGRHKLVPEIHELASTLTDLARDLGDHATRQAAADRALGVARRLAGIEEPGESYLSAAILAARMVAVDIMVFAGVDSEDIVEAVREGTGELAVPAPPSVPRMRFG
jgi:hypothetical protein